jgi:hypothetical protein
MPIPDCRSSAAFESFINNNRLKSTESKVYLNKQVEEGSFHALRVEKIYHPFPI